MRLRSSIALALFVAPLAVTFACSHNKKDPTAPILIPAWLDGSLPRPDGAIVAPDAGGGPATDFYACASDTECVAVPKVGCCANGYKEAVNTKFTDAYKRSFTCPTPNQMCPQFFVNDERVPQCNGETKKCELVAVDEIRCGGAEGGVDAGARACPQGYTCVAGADPNGLGRCQK